MSVTKKSIIFLAIAFAISWTALIVGWLRGQSMMSYVGGLMVAGPLVASLVCAMAFEKGRRIKALGLRFKPNWWWIAALFLPLLVAALAVALTVLLSGYSYVPIGEGLLRMVQAQGQDISEPQRVYRQFVSARGLMWIQFFILLTLTEEMAWRGYLYHLWRPFGFWRASFAAGFVQGAWHAPAVLLFGLNYSDHPWLGAVVLTPLLLALTSPLYVLMRERGASIWAAGIFHATSNVIGIFTIVTLDNPAFPWRGLLGIGGFAALAIINLAIFLLHLDRPREDVQKGGEGALSTV